MNRLVLIDGNALLHRAYHALPPLTSPDGTVVNAVYGFISILFRLFHDLKPTHIAVAFDRPEPTFRKKMLTTYQSQRPEMEDTLSHQIPLLQKAIASFGIPLYDKAGFEADDVIGTIARVTTEQGDKVTTQPIDQVIVVTGDRDILQLVDQERVMVFMPTKGLSEGKIYGEKEVVERMGVLPKQITDLKGLMGDASDNYPGVDGIGPKTAISLIQQFGSIEEMYTAIEENRKIKVTDSVKAKLIAGKESALLSKDLATIRTNVPIEFDSVAARIETLDTAEARTVLQSLGFQSLLKRLALQEAPTEKVRDDKKPVKKEKKDTEQLTFV